MMVFPVRSLNTFSCGFCICICIIIKLEVNVNIITKQNSICQKFQNVTNLFNLLLAIIVDSGQQNAHADSEVVYCMLTTKIEQ